MPWRLISHAKGKRRRGDTDAASLLLSKSTLQKSRLSSPRERLRDLTPRPLETTCWCRAYRLLERYHNQSLSIILKLRHQRPKATPVVKSFFWLKSMLKEYKNYVVKYFCPKLFRRLIIIKSPLVLILNWPTHLPAKILTLLCFGIEKIWDHFITNGGTCNVKVVSDLLYLKA